MSAITFMLFVHFTFMAVSVRSSGTDVTCKNYEGKPVDWFVVYKLPVIASGDPLTKGGVKFYYLDVNTPVWNASPIPINMTNQPIAETISQVYGEESILHLMYNDEKPDGGQSETHGHTKGVVGFGAKSGFWLVHSVPKFPPVDQYAYPHTGKHYGQSFLCVTLGTNHNLDRVVTQLLITYPYLYSTNVPTSMSSAKLRDLIDGKRTKMSEGNLVELTTTGGQSFQSFAKSDIYGKDLYSAWLAPYLKSSIRVETWMNGAGRLPSDCSGEYKVKNVRLVSFGGKNQFKETADHSKWAVAENAPWACVGGINRMESQEKRCGGIVCLKNADVNKSFMEIISKSDECHKKEFYQKTVILGD